MPTDESRENSNYALERLREMLRAGGVDADGKLPTERELSTSLGAWEDNARNAYVEVQRSWDASAAKQQDIVQRMPVLLGNIADGYNATESRNAGIWG